MVKLGREFWIGVALSVLGFALGASYLARGLGDGVKIRDVILGFVCLVFAGGWSAYVLVKARRHANRRR
jgi:hypothetical protein